MKYRFFIIINVIILHLLINICSVYAQSPVKQPRILREAERKRTAPRDTVIQKDKPPEETMPEQVREPEIKASERSVQIPEMAADENLYRLGLDSYNKKDYSKALQYYTKAAEQGNAGAQNNLGFMYQNGYGVQQDNAKAVEWYLKSAAKGNAGAQFNLGYIYQTYKDYERSVEWYLKSAKQDNMNAQNNLGFMYEKGYGVKKDNAKAVEWYRKSAEQGHSIAQFNLGNMYEKGLGVSKDRSMAIHYFKQAAKQRNAPAIERLNKLGVKNY